MSIAVMKHRELPFPVNCMPITAVVLHEDIRALVPHVKDEDIVYFFKTFYHIFIYTVNPDNPKDYPCDRIDVVV